MKNKYEVTHLSLENNKINIQINDLNLSHYCDVEVGLKNIKTKQVISVSSFLGEDIILIKLDSVREFCTNYEYNLVLNFQTNNLDEAIGTKASHCLIENSNFEKLDLSSIGWFLRINEKNTLLFSAIK